MKLFIQLYHFYLLAKSNLDAFALTFNPPFSWTCGGKFAQTINYGDFTWQDGYCHLDGSGSRIEEWRILDLGYPPDSGQWKITWGNAGNIVSTLPVGIGFKVRFNGLIGQLGCTGGNRDVSPRQILQRYNPELTMGIVGLDAPLNVKLLTPAQGFDTFKLSDNQGLFYSEALSSDCPVEIARENSNECPEVTSHYCDCNGIRCCYQKSNDGKGWIPIKKINLTT